MVHAARLRPALGRANGHSKADGSRLLFLMLLAGASGRSLLGPIADRIGLRRTLVITQARSRR